MAALTTAEASAVLGHILERELEAHVALGNQDVDSLVVVEWLYLLDERFQSRVEQEDVSMTQLLAMDIEHATDYINSLSAASAST